MDCNRVLRFLPAYCDEAVPPELAEDIKLHLTGCQQCGSRSVRYSHIRAALRALPALTPPADLLTSLRLLASHERSRRLAAFGPLPFVRGWFNRMRLWADGMMRPFALPMAGGLISAVALFALLAPGFSPRATPNIADVPTVLSTEATFLRMGPFGLPEELVTVDVHFDARGCFVDYTAPGGQAWVNDPVTKRSVDNAVLFLMITPGTTFGQPASGKIRIRMRRNGINVKA
jgi:hypothetical protein